MDNCNYETVIKKQEVNDQPEEQVTFENSCATSCPQKKIGSNTYNATEVKIKVEDINETDSYFEKLYDCVTAQNDLLKTIDENTSYSVDEMIVKVEEEDTKDGYCFESFVELEKNGILDMKLTNKDDLDKMQPFVCDVCHQTMTTKKKMARHITRLHNVHSTTQNKSGKQLDRRVHTGHEPYICDVCSKSFSHSCYLKIHKTVHAGIKPYECDVCLKCFSQKFHLKIHERVHTGEKGHICDVCSKSFSLRSNLSAHKRRVHTG